ncbi:unnamed protein product [Caenorhabditis sp. 36 PRJEB53466]|nr:unnamed protein product [Caenorhabditis sp. 36 PRJEB53466]
MKARTSPALFLLALLTIPTLLVGLPQNEPNGSNLGSVAKKMRTLWRLVNWIALAQGLKVKNIAPDAIAGELFHVGTSSVALEKLSSENVGHLEFDLKNVTTAIEKECGGAGGCWDGNAMTTGIDAFETTFLDFKDVLEERLSVLDELDDLQKAYNQMSVTKNEAMKLKESLELLASYTNATEKDIGDLLKTIGKRVGKVLNAEGQLDKAKQIFNSLEPQQHLDSISPIFEMEPFFKAGSAQQKTIRQMNADLKSFSTKSKNLKKALATDRISQTLNKLKLVAQIKAQPAPQVAGKRLTSGFFNGYIDFERVPTTVNSAFIRPMWPIVAIVANGGSTDKLNVLVAPLFSLISRLKPIQTSLNSVKLDDGVGRSADIVQELLKDVSASLDNIGLLEPFKLCVEMVDWNKSVNFDEWNSIKGFLESFEEKSNEFNDKYISKKSFGIFTKLKSFKRLLTGKNKTAVLENLKNNTETRTLITELPTFGNEIEALRSEILPETMPSSVLTTTTKSISEMKLDKAVDCLSLEKYKQAKSAVAPPTSLLSLQSNNADIQAVSKAANDLKAPINEWNTFKDGKIVAKRAVAQAIPLDNALKVSQKLADGVLVLINLAKAYDARNEIDDLMKVETSIDSEVGALTDATMKKNAESVWNVKSKAALKLFRAKLKVLNTEVPTDQEKITDFQKVLDKVNGFEFPTDAKSIGSSLNFVTHPATIKDALNKVGALSLEFTGAKSSLSSTSAVLKDLEAYFDSLFDIKRASTSSSSSIGNCTATESIFAYACGTFKYYWIGVIVGILSLLAIIIGGVFFWKKKLKKNKDKVTAVTATDLEGHAEYFNTGVTQGSEVSCRTSRSVGGSETMDVEGQQPKLDDWSWRIALQNVHRSIMQHFRFNRRKKMTKRQLAYNIQCMDSAFKRQVEATIILQATKQVVWESGQKFEILLEELEQAINEEADEQPAERREEAGDDENTAIKKLEQFLDANGELDYRSLTEDVLSIANFHKKGYCHERLNADENEKNAYDIKIYMTVFKAANKVLEKEKAVVQTTGMHSINVLGDIHGHVLTGDYVDRGPRNFDTVLLLCLLKIMFPNRLIILRGNHEFKSINSCYGFLAECVYNYGQKTGKQLHSLVNEMFLEMPLACIVDNKIWLSHGGVPYTFMNGPSALKDVKKRPVTDYEKTIQMIILWSDPVTAYNIKDGFFGPVFTESKRKTGVQNFNAAALFMIMSAMGWELVVRAHQVKLNGFEFFAGRRLVTLFSAPGCSDMNKAAMMHISETLSISFTRFTTSDETEMPDLMTIEEALSCGE